MQPPKFFFKKHGNAISSILSYCRWLLTSAALWDVSMKREIHKEIWQTLEELLIFWTRPHLLLQHARQWVSSIHSPSLSASVLHTTDSRVERHTHRMHTVNMSHCRLSGFSVKALHQENLTVMKALRVFIKPKALQVERDKGVECTAFRVSNAKFSIFLDLLTVDTSLSFNYNWGRGYFGICV